MQEDSPKTASIFKLVKQRSLKIVKYWLQIKEWFASS